MTDENQDQSNQNWRDRKEELAGVLEGKKAFGSGPEPVTEPQVKPSIKPATKPAEKTPEEKPEKKIKSE